MWQRAVIYVQSQIREAGYDFLHGAALSADAVSWLEAIRRNGN